MKKEPLILLGIIGMVGYITFHGHRLNVDCWMCKYRGLTFATASVGLGLYLALYED